MLEQFSTSRLSIAGALQFPTCVHERNIGRRHDARDIAEDDARDAFRGLFRLVGYLRDDGRTRRREVVLCGVTAGKRPGVAKPACATVDAETKRRVPRERFAFRERAVSGRSACLSGGIKLDPTSDVGHIRNHLAGRPHERHGNRVADVFPVTLRIETVSMCPRVRHGLRLRIRCLRQAEWSQQPLAYLIGHAVFRDFFDDEPEKQLVRIAVMVAFAGCKVGFLFHSPSDERARVESLRDGYVQVSELRCIEGLEKATKHIAELAQGNLITVGYANAQREAADGVVETELLFGDQLQQNAHHERLGVAADAEMVCRRQWPLRREIGVAECMHEACAFAIPNADQNGGKGRASAVHLVILFDGREIADWTDAFGTDGVFPLARAIEVRRMQPRINATANLCMQNSFERLKKKAAGESFCHAPLLES